MLATIKSTNKQYEIINICDFGTIYEVGRLANASDIAGTAIFQATIKTESGIEAVVGTANKGILTAEMCNIPIIRENKQLDIDAILSLRDSLFPEMGAAKIYRVRRGPHKPMTFGDAIEHIVTKKYERMNK